MKHLPFACALALAAAACADKKPPETPHGDDVAVEKHDTPKKTDHDDDSLAANADVDGEVAKMCDLPEAHFELNSAALSGKAKSVLDKLAECFKSGPGKDKRMSITGHADPRGTEDDNFALGQRRSGSVGVYLQKAGLGENRIDTGSRGELDATGTDEAGWAKDRRVEIRLAKP